MKCHYKIMKITKLAILLMFFVTAGMYAQAPTVTSFSPTVVTQKSVVTITGTNLGNVTAVKFGGTAATSFTATTTSITAIVASGTSGVVSVTNPTGTASSTASITYVAPAATAASNAVTRVMTDWGGYWSSTTTSAETARQPNTHHNLTGFTVNNGTTYSTGVDDATLTTRLGGSNMYAHSDFRALPVNSISGNTGPSSYLAMGSLIDGSVSTATYTAPGVAGLRVKDVLIDGIKGLDLGTGVTNLSASAVLSFNVNSIVPEKIIDAEPDILITQIASPSSNADLYYFTDAAGNIVGNPISANLSSINAVGTYRLDLFTLATNSAYSTVTPSASFENNGTREIRMIAFKLTDFGITSATATGITQFKCIPGGDSDTAFTAYNAASFIIPAPVITAQPTSQVVCTGTGNATFSVTATGTGLTYQWKKNGVDIPNATSSSYTVESTAANVAAYSVVVSNESGSVASQIAYLNTLISAQPASATTCQATAATLSIAANGAGLTYQWYSNTTNSTTGSTLITNATTSSYTPAVNAAGITYYYCIVNNNNTACARVTSNIVSVTVSATSVAGTISGNQAICSGSTATVSLTGYTGSIQWQESSDNSNWAAVTTGTGGTTATYTTAALTAIRYYRAVVTSGTCSTATSGTSTINITPVSVAGTPSANQTICSGTTATVSITGYTGTIQWQQSANNSTWTTIDGATSASYTSNALTATTYYKAVVTSGSCSSATSGTITVNISPLSVAGRTSANQTLCPNTATSINIAQYTGSIQWQQSADGTQWVNVSGGNGATSAVYTTPGLTATTYYRALVTSGACSSTTSATITVAVNSTFIWTGYTSTAWNTAENWACGVLPTLNDAVSIPVNATRQPTVSGIVGLAKSLTIESGAQLTVLTGGSLKVANAVTVANGANMFVEDNAALIQVNNVENTGRISVTKNSNPLYRLDYTMWSSPVIGQNLQSFSPQTISTRFYEYGCVLDRSTQTYTEYYQTVNPSNTSFETGKAYLIRMPDVDDATGYNNGAASITVPGTFTGIPNNGTVNRAASLNGKRFTAVGNPYPSPISLVDFYTQNSGIIDGNSALYFWRKRNNHRMSSYVTITMASYTANRAGSGGAEQASFYTGDNRDWLIAQGQGFIVKAQRNPSVTNITFNNSMRRAVPTTGRQAFFREGQSTTSRLWLNLTGSETAFSQAAIAYMDGATTGLDYGYDGEQLAGDDEIALYTIADDSNLAIQARPAFTPNDVVAVGYVANVSGEYALSLDHTEGVFTTGQEIYLKDNMTNTIQNITDGAYAFTSEAGAFNSRFELLYTNDALGVNTPVITSKEVIVYKEGSVINISAGTTEITDVTIYDVRGRKLLNKDNVKAAQTVISGLQAAQEVLIVEINTVKGKVSKKIVF